MRPQLAHRLNVIRLSSPVHTNADTFDSCIRQVTCYAPYSLNTLVIYVSPSTLKKLNIVNSIIITSQYRWNSWQRSSAAESESKFEIAEIPNLKIKELSNQYCQFLYYLL